MAQHPNQKPAQIPEALRNKSNTELGELYQKFQKEEIETTTHDELDKLKAELEAAHGKEEAKDLVEEQMVGKIIEERRESLMEFFSPENLMALKHASGDLPQEIDKHLSSVFKDLFGIQLSVHDWKTLREDLPVIDDVILINGVVKLVAYGVKGQSHAVVFDRMKIDEQENGYIFMYEVDVHISGSGKFQDMVDDMTVSLGESDIVHQNEIGETVQHHFEAVLASHENAQSHVTIEEVNTYDSRLVDDETGNKRNGVIITDPEQKKWTILVDESLPDEDKEHVLHHELEHLAEGMTHPENDSLSEYESEIQNAGTQTAA